MVCVCVNQKESLGMNDLGVSGVARFVLFDPTVGHFDGSLKPNSDGFSFSSFEI